MVSHQPPLSFCVEGCSGMVGNVVADGALLVQLDWLHSRFQSSERVVDLVQGHVESFG